jgi:hypothetical protein
MTKPSATALSFASNGVHRPLHQDRQVLRAGDLALEQVAQDAMLARARSYLHGWGVVAGFQPTVSGSTLSIGPGYGVTPLGDELFLPTTAELPEARERAVACCGPGTIGGCSFVDAEALAAALAAAENIAVHAWLIARPATREAEPRPGVPADCAHPATKPLPSRRCGGVEFAIVCSLPDSHQTPPRECSQLMPFVCTGDSVPPPLPWEGAVPADANFLVVAELGVSDGVLTAETRWRRRLFPVSLIQDRLASCLCPALQRIEPEPPRPEPEPPRPEPEPPRPEPAGPETGELQPFIRAGTPLPREEILRLRDRFRDPVTKIDGIGDSRAAALATIGIVTEGAFLIEPNERLALALKLPATKVAEMKVAMNERLALGLDLG